MSLEIESNQISDEEIVSRYLVSSSEFSVTNSRVKPKAFEPSPKDKCTSVFRILGLKDDEIWDIGFKNVAEPRGRTLYARADFHISILAIIGLIIRPAEPPKRHALIDRWPYEKHDIMAKAQELAAEATLALNPSQK